MKITYNAEKNAYVIIYKDYSKVKQGMKYPYGRKQVKSETPKPTKREQAARIKELKKEYAKIELATDEIEVLHGAINEAKDAVRYLESLPQSAICISKNEDVIKQETRRFQLFVDYLKEHRKGMKLHELDDKLVEDFAASLEPYSYNTFCDILNRVDVVLRGALKEFRGSALKYYNPFSGVRFKELREEQHGNRRSIFSQSDLQFILAKAKDKKDVNGRGYTMTPERIFQRYAIVYLMMVTGWRIGDVVGLRWEEVDMERRVITKIFKKTAKKQIHARLYITDKMHELLTEVKTLCQPKDGDSPLLFPLRRCGVKPQNLNKSAMQNVRNFLLSCIKHLGLFAAIDTKFNRRFFAYSPHSLRATAITVLTQGGFNESMINYLVGHSPRTVEERHYLKFDLDPQKSTAGMLEYMEQYIGARYLHEENQRRDYLARLNKETQSKTQREAERIARELVIKKTLESMGYSSVDSFKSDVSSTVDTGANDEALRLAQEVMKDKQRVNTIMSDFFSQVLENVSAAGEDGNAKQLTGKQDLIE